MTTAAPVFRRALHDRRVALMWWTFGVVVYCAFIVAVWPVIDGNEEFQDLYADMPEALQAMFGGGETFTDFTSPTGFLNTYLYSMILPFIFTGLAISIGSTTLAREERDGTLELVLSYPVARHRLVSEKIAALVVAVTAVGAVTVVVLGIAREPVSLDVGIGGLASATLGSVLFALLHGTVALAVGAWRGVPGVATGAAWGVALTGYLLNVLSNLDDSLEWIGSISPLTWATDGSPISGDVPTTYLVLVGATVALCLAAVWLFERHDVA